MAHFAEIDDSNIVKQVIVVSNDNEADGENWCKNLYGGGNWKQTSYNGNIRKNFAGIGFTYDATKDAFIPPQPFPSWTLDESTCLWKPPVDYPSDGKTYGWFESSTSWKEIAWDSTDKAWKEVS